MLVNLISNSVHALPNAGGEITLMTSDWEAHGVCITVSDNGSGMSEDQSSQIFNPFYSTKREGEGTGSRLSVSYGLIKRYGGDITVGSRPGLGSRFTLWLRTEPEIIKDAGTVAEQLDAFEEQQTVARDTESLGSRVQS